MVERKDPAFTEAPATDRAPALRPALMTPRRDSSNLVPIVILGGAMSMTLLGAIAWFQVQQRTPPDAMPVHTRSVIVYMPTPTPPQPTGAPCPSYGQRGLGANETAVPNDCVDGLPDAAALRAQATRDAMELIERGVEEDRARMELIERGVEIR